MSSSDRSRPRVLTAALAFAMLTACSGGDDPAPDDAAPTTGASASADPTEGTDPTDDAAPEVPDVPTVEVQGTTTVASSLAAPWGVALLPDGEFLVTLRDRAELVRIDPDSGKKAAITGPGAEELANSTVTAGEGGLLGLALSPSFVDDDLVFVYRTGPDGNEVLSAALTGTELGELETVIDEIPAAANHNGGGLAFGPDRMLYIGTGDAGEAELAQDIDSLAGKILRLAPNGAVPDGNPVPGLPVWSLGHRNVQGFGWDHRERMFASEFGASDLDELNIIRAGGNYGWPEFEGPGGADDGFVDPIVSWPTSEASPSGLAVTEDGIYLAALRGESVLRVPLAQAITGDQIEPQVLLGGKYGRIRSVVALADGDLLVLTNNTDGRGTAGKKDDRLLRVHLAAAGGDSDEGTGEPVPTN